MTIYHRVRALDELDSNLDDWLIYNPLFKSAVPNFDQAFDRGILLNLDDYEERKTLSGDSFEKTLLNNLFSTYRNPTGKIYNLTGSVGSGKTSLCRYLVERYIPEYFANVLAIYLDIWPSEETNETEHPELNNLFLEALYSSLFSSHKIKNLKEFYDEILSFLGFENLPPDNLMAMGDNLDMKKVLQYILNQDEFEKVLVIVDNIDETSRETIIICRKFILDIAKVVRRFGKKLLTVLAPTRDYTRTRYFDQEHFAHISLPPIKESSVMKKKLVEVSEDIKEYFQEYTQDISFTKAYYPKKFIQNRTITITKDGALEWLNKMSEKVLSKEEDIFYLLMRTLADGNLKIIVENMYNFIHSCKLPLTKLFEKTFIPKEFQRTKEYADLISFSLGLECLMNIHYPFYDVEDSHIINIFNVNTEMSANDYKNTLTIPRLIFYLQNNGTKRKQNTFGRLKEFGYNEYYVTRALDKCFNYGLIKSDHGRKSKNLEDDSKIEGSTVAKYYTETMITQMVYLQYVCEDTPMETQYIVPIQSKYLQDQEGESKEQRKESVRLFIDFLRNEETLEKNFIEKELSYNWDDYLSEFSYREGDSSISIADYVSKNWEKKTIPQKRKI